MGRERVRARAKREESGSRRRAGAQNGAREPLIGRARTPCAPRTWQRCGTRNAFAARTESAPYLAVLRWSALTSTRSERVEVNPFHLRCGARREPRWTKRGGGAPSPVGRARTPCAPRTWQRCGTRNAFAARTESAPYLAALRWGALTSTRSERVEVNPFHLRCNRWGRDALVPEGCGAGRGGSRGGRNGAGAPRPQLILR